MNAPRSGSAGSVTDPAPFALTVATLARAAGAVEWADDAQGIAGTTPDDAPDGGPPTYHALARAGVGLVQCLVVAQRWDEAARQARRMADYFAGTRAELHPLAGTVFIGLRDAVRAQDREDFDNHVDLLDELFPTSQESL